MSYPPEDPDLIALWIILAGFLILSGAVILVGEGLKMIFQ
jgi:hypothetical protein